jgi:two-component system response regulator AlgR
MNLLLATWDSNLRLSLELLLGEEPGVSIVGTASEGQGLMALMHSTSPDMVITDWELPGRSISEILATVQELVPPPAFIFLIQNMADRPETFPAGVDAFLLTGDPPDKLLAAFRRLREKSANLN